MVSIPLPTTLSGLPWLYYNPSSKDVHISEKAARPAGDSYDVLSPEVLHLFCEFVKHPQLMKQFRTVCHKAELISEAEVIQ
jgi:hypothetical protein